MLTSCGSIMGNRQANDGDRRASQLSFTVVYAKDDFSHKQGLMSVIGAFEKSHPNIVVDESKETWSESYTEYLRMKEATGEFPELVEIRDTQSFVDAGVLHEMPEELTGMLQDIPKVYGRIYTLPLNMPAPQGIIYSKEAFRQAGIHALPKTFGDFLAVCEKIAAIDISPIVVGGKDPEQLGIWINQFLVDEVYARNPDWNADRSSGKTSWRDPGPVKAMTKLASLWKKAYVAPGYQATTRNQAASVLVSGQAAMLLAGPSMFNQIKAADPSFEYGFFPLPDDDGQINAVTAPVAAGWAISAAAAADPAKLEAITQFLHFFYSEDQYPRYLQSINGIPSTRNEMNVNDPVPEAMEDVLVAMKGPIIKAVPLDRYSGRNSAPPLFGDWLYQTAPDWLSGTVSVEEAMKEADLNWDRMTAALKPGKGE